MVQVGKNDWINEEEVIYAYKDSNKIHIKLKEVKDELVCRFESKKDPLREILLHKADLFPIENDTIVFLSRVSHVQKKNSDNMIILNFIDGSHLEIACEDVDASCEKVIKYLQSY